MNFKPLWKQKALYWVVLFTAFTIAVVISQGQKTSEESCLVPLNSNEMANVVGGACGPCHECKRMTEYYCTDSLYCAPGVDCFDNGFDDCEDAGADWYTITCYYPTYDCCGDPIPTGETQCYEYEQGPDYTLYWCYCDFWWWQCGVEQVTVGGQDNCRPHPQGYTC